MFKPQIIGYRRNGCPIYQIAGGAQNPVLDRLYAERQKQVDFMDETLARVADEDRDLVDAETSNLEAARERIAELDEQIEPIEAFEQVRGASRESTGRYSSTGNGDGAVSAAARTSPRVYEYRSAGEVMADYVMASPETNAVSTEKRDAAHERLTGALARADQTTSDSPGVLPTPIIGQIESDVDAQRPFWTTQGPKALTSSGKTFNRPTVTQHSKSGKQTAELATLPTQQMKIGGVTFTKETHGGYVNVSRQDIDWTDPSAWDALLTDMQEQYAVDTESSAVSAFASAVTQSTAAAAPFADLTLQQWTLALYQAAALAYKGAGRLPDTVYCALDVWTLLGSVVDTARLANPPRTGGDMGTSSPTSFAGDVLNFPRVVLPGAADGTLIVGAKAKYECYEERIGFLQQVQPSTLGVQIAHGGTIATGALRAKGFCKITPGSGGTT